VLAAEFTDPPDYDRIEAGDELSVDGPTDALGSGAELTVPTWPASAWLAGRKCSSASVAATARTIAASPPPPADRSPRPDRWCHFGSRG